MAKFRGPIGYVESTEIRQDVWEDVATEHMHSGDILRLSKSEREGAKVNDDRDLQMSVSFIADAYANEHFFAIQYVKWAGTYWKVINTTPEGVRLILRLGGVYNGPKDEGSSGSDPEGSPTGG
jgi:hypothetical protein